MASSGSQFASSNLRRHSDPPALWGMVLLGSLLLNGGLILAFSKYVQRLEPGATPIAPIAVDFLTTAPPSEPSGRKAISTSPPKAQTANSTVPALASDQPSNPVVTKTNQSNSVLRAPVEPSPQQSPPTPATAQTASTSPTTPSIAPAPASPDQGTTSPPTDEPQVATSGVLLPAFAPPPDPKVNAGAATPTANALPLARNAPITKFVAQVTVLPQTDSPSSFAASPESIRQTKILASGEAGCLVLPEALRHFNQPEEFALTLNKTGMVVDAVPTTPAAIANKSYHQLAICTLKTLSFNPLVLPFATESDSIKLSVEIVLQKQ